MHRTNLDFVRSVWSCFHFTYFSFSPAWKFQFTFSFAFQ